ncbi:MAG: hypothetical protein QF704_06615 [Anaerolineales bacterium]|nr:hypothetical protein [Anaerolineales bacterium]
MNQLELCVLNSNQVLPHEHYDTNRVAKLSEGLKKANILRNPPIAIEWKDKYVILDGATRVTALKKLNCPHIVVQLVKQDSQDTVISSWNHVIRNIDIERLLDVIENVPGGNLRILSGGSMPSDRTSRRPLFTILDRDKTMYAVQGSQDNSDKHTDLSNAVNAYTKLTNVIRTLDSNVEVIQNNIQSFSALIKFPVFAMQEILDSAISYKLLPAGVTRFLIANRVIGMNVPLNILFSNKSLTQKNEWLDEAITKKFHQNKVRHYTEPVIIVED